MGQWEERAVAAPAPTVPPGLPELMEGLSREVLRHNPEDIYAFCARHMEELIEIRNAVNEKSTPKTPLTLEQKIERTRKLVREKSEESHGQYLKTLSTAMTATTDKVDKLERKDSGLKDEALNGNDKVIKEENSKNHEFFEYNEREISNELVDAQAIESNGTLDEKQLELDTISNDNVVVESENFKINESLATEKLIKEGENVMANNLLEQNVNNENVEVQDSTSTLSDAVIKESPRLQIINNSAEGSKSEINIRVIENVCETNFTVVDEKLVNQVGESESVPKEETKIILNNNFAEISANLTKEGNQNLPETVEVTETSENIREKTKSNNSIAEYLLLEEEESLFRKTMTEKRESLNIYTIDETNENSHKNNQIREGLAEETTTGMNESVHSDKITEKDKSIVVMNDEFENLTQSKSTDVSHSMIDSTSTTDQRNAIVIENTAEKNQNFMEESAIKESNTLTNENIGKTSESVSIERNDVVEVNSIFLDKLPEEHTHLIDDKIKGESKGLTGEHMLAKRENVVEDKMLNGNIPDVNVESETQTFIDGKIDVISTDNAHKDKQLVENPVKDSKSFLGFSVDKNIIEVRDVDPKNEEVIYPGNNDITQTELIQEVEIVASAVNFLNNVANNPTQNTTNEDEVQVAEKVAEQPITNSAEINNLKPNNVHEIKAEKSKTSDNIEIMVLSDTAKVQVSQESNGIERTENVANTINIDENGANNNFAKTNNAGIIDAFHIKTDKEHSTEKFHDSKENLTELSERSTYIRKKRSIGEADNHINSSLQTNDHNEIEKVITVNADNESKEKNEIFENCSNDEPFIEQKDNVSDQKLIADKDNNTASDPAKISSNNKEIESSNNQEFTLKVQVTKTVNESTDNVKHTFLENNIEGSVPEIFDTNILQKNAELMILSHTENDNTEIRTNSEDTEEQLHKSTYDIVDKEYKGVSLKSETGSSSDTKFESTEIKTSDEKLQDSSDKKSFTVEDKENNKSDSDGNKLKTSESMDLETAAITIQKAFQAFLFESTASNSEDNENDGNSIDMLEENMTAPDSSTGPTNTSTNESVNERRPPGLLTRTNTVLQTVNEEKSLSLSTDESSGLSSAATVIQAHVRGFLVRNRLSLNKFTSSDTPANSVEAMPEDVPRVASAKTVLKINIPEQDNYASIGDSIDTSMDLPMDPVPSVVNLHPLGYDKDARKPLKREDAIQSISPPSNSSLKLSEEVYSLESSSIEDKPVKDEDNIESNMGKDNNDIENVTTTVELKKKAITRVSSDEMDVVTPYNRDSESTQLLHSSEFHDVLLPTQVVRTDSTVVREFRGVLVYFIRWHST